MKKDGQVLTSVLRPQSIRVIVIKGWKKKQITGLLYLFPPTTTTNYVQLYVLLLFRQGKRREYDMVCHHYKAQASSLRTDTRCLLRKLAKLIHLPGFQFTRSVGYVKQQNEEKRPLNSARAIKTSLVYL